jgi:hypothetical protein
MQWKKYPKGAVVAVMQSRSCNLGAEKPSFFDISKWPQWWESGAKELEKTTPGKLITAPVRLTETAIKSSKEILEETPKAFKTITRAVPFIAIGAAAIGAAYLVYKLPKGKKSETQSISECH